VEDIQKRIGANIRQLRSKAGFSQEGLAELAGVNRTHMGQLERGECNVTIQTLKIIADALGVKVSDLIKGV
jgi:XRE family transcriptional regulator, regulator of sulfur utilization